MFPLYRRDDRRLPGDFEGHVVTCDVDKTYLETDFRSLGGLLRIPLEWAEDKLTVPGMAAALSALRHGPGAQSRLTPLYFLTASPPPLARSLERKMLLDGVQNDGITCKAWKTILMRRRPAWIKRQIAYKLSALLHQRTFLPREAREILIGDDIEIDPLAYALYADILAKRIDDTELLIWLRHEGCDVDEIREVMEHKSALRRPGDRVEAVYIRLVSGRGPAAYHVFGADMVTYRSPLQLALSAVTRGYARETDVVEVARELLDGHGVTPEVIDDEFHGAVERGLLTPALAYETHDQLQILGLASKLDPTVNRVEARCAPSRDDRGGRWTPSLEEYEQAMTQALATDAAGNEAQRSFDF
ncbi:hypothetical protein KDL45_12130 [bacterium]|nr:hypothetical protein [bacterium]